MEWEAKVGGWDTRILAWAVLLSNESNKSISVSGDDNQIAALQMFSAEREIYFLLSYLLLFLADRWAFTQIH